MNEVVTIGVDLAKNVFQQHGVDAEGAVVVRRRLRHISKAGNRYLRMLRVVGALSAIRRAKQVGATRRPWLAKLLQPRSTKIAAGRYDPAGPGRD